MYSIDDVRTRLGEFQKMAARGDEPAALAYLRGFVCDLVQDDSGFFLVKAADGGLAATPAREGDPRLFLRAYTHSELSSLIPANAGAVYISSLDFLRYLKWAFLRGVYGVILNEGDTWAAVPVTDILNAFNERAFPGETTYSREFVDSICIVSAARQNGAYGLICANNGGMPSVPIDDVRKTYIVPRTDDPPAVGDAEWLPITTQTLFYVGDKVEADILNQKLCVSGDSVRRALDVCGIVQNGTEYSPVKIFYNEPAGGSGISLDDVKSLFLCFEEPDGGKQAEEILLTESPNTEVLAEPSATEPEAPIRKPHSLFSLIAPASEAESKEEDAVDGEEPAEERVAPKRKRSPLAIVLACVLFLLLITGVIVGRTIYAEHSAMAKFRGFVESGNYAEAFYVYTEDSLGQSADDVITKEIGVVTKKYVLGELSDNEFASKMGVFSLFPNQEQALNSAYATADIIRESHKAYELGNSAGTVYEKLHYWSMVSPLDEVNYDIVQSELKKNKDEWRGIFLEKLELFADIDRGRAKEILGAALKYYPDDLEFIRYDSRFREEDARPARNRYPVHIDELAVKDAPETNSVSLYIRWGNISGKAIDSIDFYFVFMDENNTRVTYWSDTGEVSVFRGEESSEGPYEPGFVTDSDTWGWVDLWQNNGSRVAKVKLTAVNIWFSDGETDSFVTETDLNRLFV